MSVKLPPLPFSVDALEPQMSQETLEVHYGKHHAKYVDTLNKLIKGTALDRKNLVDIMITTAGNNEKIYNNAAQAWNHTFFWDGLTDSDSNPSAALKKELTKHFGSLADFKKEFETQAAGLFGSGWVWLVKDKNKKLRVRPLANAGNPIAELGETPLLTCDVWEHAYYLDYKNERGSFVKNFWKIVNWDFVEMNLEESLSKSSGDGKSLIYNRRPESRDHARA